MKFSVLLLAVTMIPFTGFANESRTIEQMLNESKMEKIQAESMVDTMMKSGRLTKDQGDRVRRSIASVQEENIESIKEEALANIKAPNIANK